MESEAKQSEEAVVSSLKKFMCIDHSFDHYDIFADGQIANKDVR